EMLREEKADYLYACGPNAMLKGVEAAAARHGLPGQVSLEAFMGCGLGACLVCACGLPGAKDGYAKVCSDGPVFGIGEVAIHD
ncbi:MAG: dihydroorotate dehydrogenase electron transfer subunit, partial [Clostridiales bacterium]|nr:dihydroorotate dehydrogenase electron transfer subunit [Clostridiales bacterium]